LSNKLLNITFGHINETALRIVFYYITLSFIRYGENIDQRTTTTHTLYSPFGISSQLEKKKINWYVKGRQLPKITKELKSSGSWFK